MEKDKEKQNQLRYQIQNNTLKENQQTQTVIIESSPILDTPSHYDRKSRVGQSEFHSNDHSNNTQNEELVNNIDEITFAKQNHKLIRNPVDSSACQVSKDVLKKISHRRPYERTHRMCFTDIVGQISDIH